MNDKWTEWEAFWLENNLNDYVKLQEWCRKRWLREPKCGEHTLFTPQICAELSRHQACGAHLQVMRLQYTNYFQFFVNVHHNIGELQV